MRETHAHLRRCAVLVAAALAAACGEPTSSTPPDPWSDAVRVADVTDRSQPRDSASPLSCLAVGGDGRALVVWSERGPDADVLWAQDFPANGAPGNRERLQGAERFESISEIRCGLDATGLGYVSWVEYAPTESRLLARRLGSQGWEPRPFLIDQVPYPIAPGLIPRMRHDLAVDERGRALIAWTGRPGIRSGLAVDGVWTDAGLLEAGPLSGTVDVRVQTRAPFALAAYARDYTFPGGQRGMAASTRFLGPSGWEPAHPMITAQGVSLWRPTLDDQGRSTLVSAAIRFPTFILCTSRYQQRAWSDASCSYFSSGDATPAGNGSGEVFVPITGEGTVPQAARWLPGASAPVIETMGTGDRFLYIASAALAADGTSYAAWIVNKRPLLGRARAGGPWVAEPIPGTRVLPSPLPCSDLLFNGTTEARLGTDTNGNVVTTWIDGNCGTGTLWLQRRRNDRP